MVTPMAIHRIMSEAFTALENASVNSPTTPCISMSAKRARYINTPGTIGMTLGMAIHWSGVWNTCTNLTHSILTSADPTSDAIIGP